MDDQQRKALNWFQELRSQVWNIWQQHEPGYYTAVPHTWEKGQYNILKGKHYEKAGVAWSNVEGLLPAQMSLLAGKPFWSSGTSVVIHPSNPHVPGMHFNTRFITTEDERWFGGGMDITPYVYEPEILTWYRKELKEMCDFHDVKYYPKFSKDCDEYFHLHHRDEPRGAGGIFFDYMSDDYENTFRFIQDVGRTFITVMTKLVQENKHKGFTEEERNDQLVKRGRYVEFNLLHDKGTRFGLESGGNVNAILMSMPPDARWE
ncbi:MAG: coproporphyrinogen III oxidase [Euryarchaeota archaeon]|nr:coproporphyrinogen III oxidase [Euryarchaeota archaeon]